MLVVLLVISGMWVVEVIGIILMFSEVRFSFFWIVVVVFRYRLIE